MKNKLVLGTAQFGLNYGISNQRGKIPQKEIFKILKYAVKNKIDFLDTAYSYGDSEKIIGEFIKVNKTSFNIISKLPKCNSKAVKGFFFKSLARLKQDKIYGYLVHDFKSFLKDNTCWNVLEKLKKERKIKKIGFSLYYPSELKYLLKNNIDFDIIQIPYNIFDQRFTSYFSQLKKRKIEIYIRSVFLQGLVFKNPNKLEKKFIKIKDKLTSLRLISEKLNIPISAVCLNFTILNSYIDKVLIGVDSIDNLKENIKALKYKDRIKNIYSKVFSLKEDDKEAILPINWQ